MKKVILTILLLTAGLVAQAQDKKEEGIKFTDTKTIPCTSIKDQYRSGTCWCFSGVGYLESEILKASGKEIDLSEMWLVRNLYFEKVVKYVRLHGSLNLEQGGGLDEVLYAAKKYGVVPEEVYHGHNYGTEKPEFGELIEILKSYAKAVVSNRNRKLTTAWMNGLNGILDAYFGPRVEEFTYQGKQYTPTTFLESLPIKTSDYISLTSFTHHPFYEKFIIEIPDNWLWQEVYNVTMDEMMQVIDSAMEQGYAVLWGTDVSEKGFNRQKAIGVIPQEDVESLEGTDAAHWNKLSATEKNALIYGLKAPVKEKQITQEMRQKAFDNYETTDDHGMIIIGTATDQAGHPFYKVKNSWGVRKPYDGYYYFSRPFVQYKTIDIMVNKKAVSKEILKKLKVSLAK
ncbi:MAG: aminopeptidase [Alistipes sp.]|nr:aminopeptidase [Candidatus Alistipes equi]